MRAAEKLFEYPVPTGLKCRQIPQLGWPNFPGKLSQVQGK